MRRELGGGCQFRRIAFCVSLAALLTSCEQLTTLFGGAPPQSATAQKREIGVGGTGATPKPAPGQAPAVAQRGGGIGGTGITPEQKPAPQPGAQPPATVQGGGIGGTGAVADRGIGGTQARGSGWSPVP